MWTSRAARQVKGGDALDLAEPRVPRERRLLEGFAFFLDDFRTGL
jgi:hypothetical protein